MPNKRTPPEAETSINVIPFELMRERGYNPTNIGNFRSPLQPMNNYQYVTVPLRSADNLHLQQHLYEQQTRGITTNQMQHLYSPYHAMPQFLNDSVQNRCDNNYNANYAGCVDVNNTGQGSLRRSMGNVNANREPYQPIPLIQQTEPTSHAAGTVQVQVNPVGLERSTQNPMVLAVSNGQSATTSNETTSNDENVLP